jgi:DNA (cytosine-5)-methyltransferase 1
MKTHLDLFSGIGGFAIAAQNCGYTTIGFCEKEPYAQQILKERFGAVLADAESSNNGRENAGSVDRSEEKRRLLKSCGCNRASRPLLHPDIFTLNGADYAGVDLLTGGFPCQPFSVAGKRRGAADDRAIWPEMLRVIDGAKPAWIIGENVAGIVTMELDNILSDLEAIGYAAWPLVVPACAVDARHRRDRVWIVAHAIGLRESQSSGSFADERGRAGNQGEDVAAADEPSGKRDERTERSQPERAEHKQHRGRFPQSTIRRMADGIPEGLDSGGEFCQWPEEDHETPRVTTGMKHRSHRLRGLGNAIVPQVAEEIIRAITSLK